MIFRLTHNNPFDDCATLGDRTLSSWVSPSTYHFSSYTYTNLYGSGVVNDVQDMPYGELLLNQWNYIYIAYSRAQ
jgi:hypothetical protein